MKGWTNPRHLSMKSTGKNNGTGGQPVRRRGLGTPYNNERGLKERRGQMMESD